MAKTISNKEGNEWLIFCPACKRGHMFKIPPWTFNGNIEKPTFRASMLVKIGPFPEGSKWAGLTKICHSFVTDGKIQYLPDCTHEFAGKILDLPDLDNYHEI